MSVQPTSAYTFEDLILEVARKLGVGYYGETGGDELQVPEDKHDLAECKRHVNNGLRAFVQDGPPPNGWRWTKPVGSVTIFGDLAADSSKTLTSSGFTPATGKTTLIANVDSFYDSMEERSIEITSVGTFVIADVVDAKTIRVRGDATAASAATWAITTDGNFTLPRDFGGQFAGRVTYASDTNQGVSLEWTDESTIRLWRENITDETGDPFWIAIRPLAGLADGRRRWELMTYPAPDEIMEILFPYQVYFDRLIELDESPPMPYWFDEALKTSCLAAAEKDQEDMPGPDTQYYRQVCLPAAHRMDAAAAPKRLGYFGNPSSRGTPSIRQFRQMWYQRPTVSVNT